MATGRDAEQLNIDVKTDPKDVSWKYGMLIALTTPSRSGCVARSPRTGLDD